MRTEEPITTAMYVHLGIFEVPVDSVPIKARLRLVLGWVGLKMTPVRICAKRLAGSAGCIADQILWNSHALSGSTELLVAQRIASKTGLSKVAVRLDIFELGSIRSVIP